MTTTRNMSFFTKLLISLLILAVIGILAYAFLTMPDPRSLSEKMDDAANELSRGEGVGKASRELEDRTPGERAGDAVKDAGDAIKKNTDR